MVTEAGHREDERGKRGSVRFSAWYGIAIAVLIFGQWGFFLASGNVLVLARSLAIERIR